MFWHDIKEIKEWMGRITDRLDDIDENIQELKKIKEKDYENNSKNLEKMILEFKGCISMARSALVERKEADGKNKKK